MGRAMLAFLVVSAGACTQTHLKAPETGLAPTVTADCMGQVIPFGTTVIGSTHGRDDLLRASCARGSGPECVVSVDVPTRANLRIGVESDEIDAALALLGNSRDPADQLACADDTPAGDTRHARIDATVEPGRYRILIDSVSEARGDFELFVQLDPVPPLSEICANAKPLALGVSTLGTTRGESNQFAASCAGGAAGPDVVHTITLSKRSRVRFHQQSEFDGSIHLRATCLDPSTELGCNDDFGDSRASGFARTLAAGTYYLITDSYSAQQAGPYSVLVETLDEPRTRSLDERCAEAKALPIEAGRYELDTFGEPSTTAASCGGDGSPEYVFALTVKEPRELRARLDGPEFNAVLSVRGRCSDAKSELVCYENVRTDASALARMRDIGELRVTLDPGTYFLIVDGKSAEDMGAATLDVQFGPPVPPV